MTYRATQGISGYLKGVQYHWCQALSTPSPELIAEPSVKISQAGSGRHGVGYLGDAASLVPSLLHPL
jgi:hypothetical protein